MGTYNPEHLFPIALAVIAVGMALTYAWDVHRRSKLEQKRGDTFLQLSFELGLNYRKGKDTDLPQHYFFIRRLKQGSDRYAFNCLTGEYSGHAVCLFDYHYETQSANRNGMTRHDISMLVLHVRAGDEPASFPELVIAPEGAYRSFSKSFGADNINFESLEFSKQFCVRSKDKKFAYDICHPRIMEYLLAHPDLTLEFNLYTIALTFSCRLKPNQIRPNLDRLLAIRSLVPDYVLNPA